jgi:carboxymethylenebutenolidase
MENSMPSKEMIVVLPLHILTFVCFVAFGASCVAAQALPQDLSVDSKSHAIVVTRYAAAGIAQRPAVLILHGSGGPEVGRNVYVRHAQLLAGNGIDAYLVSYFGPRSNLACNCVHIWRETVVQVTHAILQRPEASGRIGLVGFSLGGVVAVASARDAGATAVVVFYGFMPPEPLLTAGPLPSILALHGDADDKVPLKWGQELVERARERGGRADLVIYPGEPHVLSNWSKRHATDAVDRMIAFFRAELL